MFSPVYLSLPSEIAPLSLLLAAESSKTRFFLRQLISNWFNDTLSGWSDADGTLCYKINIHVPLVVSDTQIYDGVIDTTTNDLGKIALSQATSYLIADYFNVFTYADVAAKSKAEKDYTIQVTAISTLLSSLIMLPVTVATAGANSLITGTAKEASAKTICASLFNSQIAAKSVSQILAQNAAITAARYIASIPLQVMTEVFEELYVDPLIERVVRDIANNFGASESTIQFISSFVCSFRESFMGGITTSFDLMFDSDVNINTVIELENDLRISQAQYQSLQEQAQSIDTSILQDSAINSILEEAQSSLAEIQGKLDKARKKLENKKGLRSIINLGRIPDLINIILSGPSFLVGGAGLASFTLISDFAQDLIFDIIPDMSKAKKTLKILELIELSKHTLDPSIQNQKQKSTVTVASGPQTKDMSRVKELFTSGTESINEMLFSVIANLIKVDELKVNSESDFNEILIQMARKKGEGTIMVFLEGLSLYPKFEPGSLVPVKIMRTDAEYEVGDIVLFQRSGVYVVHEIAYKYTDTEGTIRYTTRGLNHETNPRVDRGVLSGDQIIGIADLSEDFLAGIPALESQGLLFHMKAYGMSNQFDSLLQKAKKVYEELTNVDQSNNEAVLDALVEYMELLFEFKRTNFDHLDIRNKFIQGTIEADLLACYLRIANDIFTGYSSVLFKQMFSKLIGKSFNMHNPNDIRLDTDKLQTLTEIISCVSKFYHLEDAINEISKSKKEINDLIKEVWGDDYNYPRLINEHRNSIEYFRIENGKIVNKEKIVNDEKIIWDISGANIEMKEGYNFYFDPGKQDIWLALGDINYGLVHLLSGSGKTGHLVDFMKLDQKLNNPEIIAKFIYDRIMTQTGVIMNEYGRVVYAFKLKGSSTLYFLAVGIDGNDGNNVGRIHTAFPVLPGTKNYNEYWNYFNIKENQKYIKDNLVIE
jgi:hypothetical protein